MQYNRSWNQCKATVRVVLFTKSHFASAKKKSKHIHSTCYNHVSISVLQQLNWFTLHRGQGPPQANLQALAGTLQCLSGKRCVTPVRHW